MRLLLTYEGYDVRTAERAEDALHMLTSYRPELVLADIQLPGMDGLEMTRKIKGNPRTSGIRVVALTACNVSGDKERAYRAGCEDYITKPIDTTTLASRVRELLARRPIERVEAPKPGPDVQPALSFSGPEMETLRRRFLSEGIERSQRLLATLDSGFDSAKAARQLHEWAGSAALIGCARISELSRKAESLLREESWESPCLREVLCDLLVTFAELSDSKAVPLPEYIVKAMTGKRVALVGLTQEHSDNMCAMLERVEARPRLFSVTDDPSCEAIQECDLVIVHVRPETLDSSWLRSAPPIAANRTFVLTGARRDLMALAPDVRMRAAEFLAGTGEPDEVLMRLAFALSRQTAPGSVRTAAANGISSSAAEVDAGPVVSRTTGAKPDASLVVAAK